MGSCDVGPCSGVIKGDGFARRVAYEYDADNYQTLRVERAGGKVYQREETRYSDDHRSSDYRVFSEEGGEYALRVIRKFDAAGRPIREDRMSPEGLLARRVFRYESASCPYGASGEVFDGDGEQRATIASRCEDGRLVESVERGLDGEILRKRTFSYDERDRWVGLAVTDVVHGETFSTSYTAERDARGFIEKVSSSSSGDVQEEVADMGCWALTDDGLRRRVP